MRFNLRPFVVILALAVAAVAVPSVASSSTRTSTHHSTTKRKAKKPATPKSTAPSTHRAAGVAHNSHGRIQRSEVAKHTFEVRSGYPHGRPGYVVDHIVPLACGGKDVPSNMQWQTIAAAKAKDKTERLHCR